VGQARSSLAFLSAFLSALMDGAQALFTTGLRAGPSFLSANADG